MSDKYDSTNDTMEHIGKVQVGLRRVGSILNARAMNHDKSKLESPEKEMFDQAVGKLKEVTYGTQEYQKCLDELGPALKHHYEHNSHHPEHYTNGISGMSLFDVIEMLIDWKAATERMKDGGCIWKSIEHNKKRFGLSDQVTEILRNTAYDMGWGKDKS